MVWVCGILEGVTLVKSQLFVRAMKRLVPFLNFGCTVRLSKGLAHLEVPGSFRQSLRIPCLYNDSKGLLQVQGGPLTPQKATVHSHVSVATKSTTPLASLSPTPEGTLS